MMSPVPRAGPPDEPKRGDRFLRETGGVVGSYRIVAELARGGMGRVYLARRAGEAGFERLFAVKVMHGHMADDAGAIKMLLDEAHIASRLHHPNVVPVVDVGTYADGFYLVMEYVEGCSLQQLLRKQRSRRPPGRVVPVVLDALHGLHAVHSLTDGEGHPYNVVHRDVSPHNLLIGIDGVCRITDFGIAKANLRLTDTAAGLQKGKVEYMAPEQLSGDASLDLRADIFSAGLTLYVALTGQHPFRGNTDIATMHNLMTITPRPPSEVGLQPPAIFDDLVLRALDRDPCRRFTSAREFGEALRRVAISHDLLDSPADVAEWIDESFGPELAERRRAIRGMDAVTTTGRNTPISISLSGSIPALPGDFSAPSHSGRAIKASPVLETREPSTEIVFEDEMGAKPSSGSPTLRWLPALLVAFVLVVAGAWFATQRAEPAPVEPAEARHEPGLAPPQNGPETPLEAAAAMPVTAPVPEAEVATPMPEAQSATPAFDVQPTRGPGFRSRTETDRGRATTPARSAPAASVVAPAPQQPASATPPPEPAVAAPRRPAMERNPYLQGE
jgi:eukaryotic-like serine/threonine-protein kinase